MAVTGRNHWERLSGASGGLRRAFGGLFAGSAGMAGRRIGLAVAAVEIGLVIVIGLVAGRMAMTLVSPLPVAEEPPSPSPAREAVRMMAGNPFRSSASPELEAAPVSAAAAETTLDLKLHGAWVEADGKNSAIIRTPDGKQKIFFVGDVICCGAELESVHPDEVIISRAGVRESLRLSNKRPASRPAAPENEPRIIESGAADLATLVTLQPARGANGDFRLQIFPGQDERAFEAAGLQAGDILISVNGRPAPKDLASFAELLRSLEGKTEAELLVERGGAATPLAISLGEPPQIEDQ